VCEECLQALQEVHSIGFIRIGNRKKDCFNPNSESVKLYSEQSGEDPVAPLERPKESS